MEYNKTDTYFANPISMEYTYSLDSEISDPEDYREFIQLLRNATENDVVCILISNFGGALHTTISMVNAIRNCQATTVGVLTSIAYSAAGPIFLACDVQEVQDHAELMAHDAQTGYGGSITKCKSRMEHDATTLRRFYEDVYQDFFSQEEINDILNDKDTWLLTSDIKERLVIREETRVKREEESQQQEESAIIAEIDAMMPSKDILKKLSKADLIRFISDEIAIDLETGEVIDE